jgi:hypothetical protein
VAAQRRIGDGSISVELQPHAGAMYRIRAM